MTLEQTIISEAPLGFSKRECPGGWIAYVAKPIGRLPLVRYVHTNSAEAIHRIVHNQVRLLLFA